MTKSKPSSTWHPPTAIRWSILETVTWIMYRNDDACGWIRQYRDDGWPVSLHFNVLQDYLQPNYESRPECIDELRDWLYNAHGYPINFVTGDEPVDVISAHHKDRDARQANGAVVVDYSSVSFADEPENRGCGRDAGPECGTVHRGRWLMLAA